MSTFMLPGERHRQTTSGGRRRDSSAPHQSAGSPGPSRSCDLLREHPRPPPRRSWRSTRRFPPPADPRFCRCNWCNQNTTRLKPTCRAPFWQAGFVERLLRHHLGCARGERCLQPRPSGFRRARRRLLATRPRRRHHSRSGFDVLVHEVNRRDHHVGRGRCSVLAAPSTGKQRLAPCLGAPC